MKKTKLLILSLLTLASSSAWGQTDVTSDYLVNPSFETGNVEAITSLDGWTLPSLGGSFVNISLGSSSACNGNAFGIPTPSDGDKYYFNRRGWNSNASSEGTLSTVTKIELPEGKYTISFDYKVLDSYDKDHTSKGSTLTIKAIASDNVLAQETITFEAVNGNSAGAEKFTNDAWQTLSAEFNVTSPCQVTFSIVEKLLGGVRSDVVIDNVKLYFDNTVDKTNLNALITEAEGLYSVSGIGAATFKTAIDEAKAVNTNASATIADVLNAETALQAAIDNFKWANASSENPVDITSKIVNADCSSTEGWSPVTCNPNSGQHWDGTTTNKYLEPCNWNANSWTGSALQTISVPNGHYKLVAAGRASEGVTLKLVANSQEVTFETLGDVGGTIATDGTEWSSVAEGISAGKSFANNNGRGWTYKSIDDIIIIDKDLQLGAKSSSSTLHSWCSIDDFKLFYTGPITEADKVPAAKADLLAAIEAKPAISANVGDGAFQYSTANADSYNKILTDAQDVYDNPSATLADVNNAKESVTNATLPTLNGPKENTRYALVLKYEGWAHDNKAVTYIANGRSDAGNYNIQYLTPVNVNYAQAFIFTPVEGDKYKLSQIDADGNERFISTGVPYGGNTSQIRTTTTADDALLVEVRATATEGKWNLWNTEANNYIGSQDAGVFTVNSHIDFEIVEAKEIPGITITAAKYATFIAPVAVTIPSEVTAYSCAEVDGTTLTLTEIETTIPANTPAILYAEGGYTGESLGYSNANPAENTNTAGLLTGVYADTEISEGYVLVNRDGAKFVVVDGTPATVPANRAYLTVPSGVKEFALEDATSIAKVVPAFGSDNESIFNLAGQRVGSDFKGIVIKNGKKQLNK